MRLLHYISWRGLLFFILVIGSLTVINLTWLIPTINAIRKSTSELALERANRLRSEITAQTENALRDLSLAAEEIAVNKEESRQIMWLALKKNNNLRSISIVNKQGQETLRVDRFQFITPEHLVDHSKDPSFYLALEGIPNFGEVQSDSRLGPYMTIMTPLRIGGKIKGVISADFDIRGLNSILQSVSQNQTSAYVVNPEGKIIIHPDNSVLQRQPNLISLPIIRKLVIDGVAVDGLNPEDSYYDFSGEKVFAVGLPIPASVWGIVVQQPWKIAFAKERRIINFAIIIFAISIFLFSVSVWSSFRLEKLGERLEQLLQENYESAKMLIRKDEQLTFSNEKLTKLNAELDEIGKILVRRDLELTKANTRLQELDAMKSEFVSVAAHQLRTPLTGIKWSFSVLLDKDTGKLNSEQRYIIEGGLNATDRAISLINDLLNVARIEEGRFGFTFEKKPLDDLIKKLVEQFQEHAQKKSITLSYLAPSQALPPVIHDPSKLPIAITNLIDNAIKYTNAGGKVEVRLSKKNDKYIQIEVSDTGIGIPKEQLGRLFTKFFRADNAVSMQTTGTGLGLYLTKNIIEKHKGIIKATSQKDKGSTFTILLPIAEQNYRTAESD